MPQLQGRGSLSLRAMLKQPTSTDYPKIFHLLERAFAPSVSESTLVKDLKDKDKIALDVIIEHNGRLSAYICYSLAYDSRKAKIGYHLAPLAVLPEKQRQGLGKRITRESLKLLPEGQPVYVLGDPEYYKQFGFRIDKTQQCRFDPEGNHFMVLFKGALPPRELLYEEEFYELA